MVTSPKLFFLLSRKVIQFIESLNISSPGSTRMLESKKTHCTFLKRITDLSVTGLPLTF